MYYYTSIIMYHYTSIIMYYYTSIIMYCTSIIIYYYRCNNTSINTMVKKSIRLGLRKGQAWDIWKTTVWSLLFQ